MWFGLLHQLIGENQAEGMVKNIRALQSITCRHEAAVKVGVLSPIRSSQNTIPILQLWAEREEGILGYKFWN